MSRRVLLITNPVAARSSPTVVREIEDWLRAEGCQVDVAGTNRPEDTEKLAASGIADGVDVIAVYGGDGTVSHAIGAVVGHSVPLALIPGGTGNLLAHNLGLPRQPKEAARAIVRGVPKPVDIGRVVREGGEQYFTVACGAGFDAEIMLRTSGRAKRRWGSAAYIAGAWGSLPTVAAVTHRVTVDDQVLDLDATTVFVANCRDVFPPFIRLREGTALDDGWFDVVALKASGVLQSLSVVGQLLFRREAVTNGVRYARGRTVTVECGSVRPVQLDGENAGTTPFTAELLPGGIGVLVES